MLYTRYAFAVGFCHGKEVLEVGCGCGMGLGYLGQNARRLVGGDFTESLLRRAHAHYGGRVLLVRLDAQALPFRNESFDIVILFEAIYYLPRPEDFLTECKRILRPDGVLLLCLPNKEWEGFNPSPRSTQYFSARELQALLSNCSFAVDLLGAFRNYPRTLQQKISAAVRKTAVRLRVIPKTMRGKEFLKRLFYGQLVELTEEIEEGTASAQPLMPLSTDGPMPEFKILYVLARPRSPRSAILKPGSQSTAIST